MPTDPTASARPNDRQAREVSERNQLAAYAMPSAASRGREHPCEPCSWRTEYQRDRDRIVHARAFRRLGYKTQVFANDQGDLFRTRLTHTLEVVQAARAVSRRLGVNEDLVECIALIHDLGHPPFGHRGEDMLDELLRDHGGFNHNRQALRIVSELERRYVDFPGLNLSYEVREGIAKHGWQPGGARVPSAYHPEEAPLVEAQLVDEVDSIAYDCHDIDDGIRAGVIKLDALQELGLWRGAWQQAVAASPRETSPKLLADLALRVLLDAFLDDLAEHSQGLLDPIGSLDQVRASPQPLVAPSQSMVSARAELEGWLFDHLYRDWRVNRTFHKARQILAALYEFYTATPDTLPDEHQARIDVVGLERVVGDYIAGMTDRFALEEHARLFDPSVRAW